MIDTMGYGIHEMYAGQRRRFFPLPDYDLSDADLTGCSEPFLPVTSVVELSTDIPSAPPIEFGNHVGPPLMIPVNKWWALMLLSALILLYARRFKQN